MWQASSTADQATASGGVGADNRTPTKSWSGGEGGQDNRTLYVTMTRRLGVMLVGRQAGKLQLARGWLMGWWAVLLASLVQAGRLAKLADHSDQAGGSGWRAGLAGGQVWIGPL